LLPAKFLYYPVPNSAANGIEKAWIRKVLSGIPGELARLEYNNLTMADLQAVLWYAEKRLYDSVKVQESIASHSEE